MNEALLRFLSLAKKELGGVDSRAEIGGRPPTSEDVVFHETKDQLRIVVLFDAPPEDAPALRERLATLSQGFLASSSPPSVRAERPVYDDSAGGRLDEALDQLVERAGGRVSAVVDRTSPLLWGASLEVGESRDVSSILAAAENGPSGSPTDRELLGRAVARIRSDEDHEDGLFIEDSQGFALRWFAGIYCLVVTFDREASELRVESSIIRALPIIETMVLSLPPLEPEPKGRKMIRLPFRVV